MFSALHGQMNKLKLFLISTYDKYSTGWVTNSKLSSKEKLLKYNSVKDFECINKYFNKNAIRLGVLFMLAPSRV